MPTSIFNRREGLVVGAAAGLWGLSLQGFGRSQQIASPRAKRCILVWLDGGPSHLETFDPKPDAPAEVRGPLGVVAAQQSGIYFAEGLPQLAQRSDRLTVIRSMTSPVGEHNLATQYALSGHIPGGRAAAPAFLLPIADFRQNRAAVPAHIAIPDFNLGGGSKLNGYLERGSLPWSLGSEPSEPAFLDSIFPLGRLDSNRLGRRKALSGESLDPTIGAAIDLLQGPEIRQVFDLSKETLATRARYGAKPIGQNCLLARRLLESGVPLVTVNSKGWDTHERLHERLHAGYVGAKVPVGLVPSMDQAVAALLDDLESSGLIDETLVVVMGEFGRTPKINSQGGRDHWARAYSVLLSGAGITRGQIYGRSDRVGETASENPVTPSDLVATLYHLLGIDPLERVATPDGQQLVRVPETASIIQRVLS